MFNGEMNVIHLTPWIGLTEKEAEDKAREDDRLIVIREVSQYDIDSTDGLPEKTVVVYLSPEGKVEKAKIVPVFRI